MRKYTGTLVNNRILRGRLRDLPVRLTIREKTAKNLWRKIESVVVERVVVPIFVRIKGPLA